MIFVEKNGLFHYQNQSKVVDTKLLKKDEITFSVLVSILQNECTSIYTDHENIVICLSMSPYPVWVWCKDVKDMELVSKIALCLKEEFPLENGYTYNLSYDLLEQLKVSDVYFEQSQVSMNLLSYRLNEMKQVNVPCDGKFEPARTTELDYLVKLWHDLCLEMSHVEYDEEFCRKAVLAHLAPGTLFSWRNEKDELVALTSKGDVNCYSKVSSVYTLPEHRRKGYAINLVSKVTEGILESKRIPILYTDATYGASNSCYKKIGYEEVGSLCTVGRK